MSDGLSLSVFAPLSEVDERQLAVDFRSMRTQEVLEKAGAEVVDGYALRRSYRSPAAGCVAGSRVCAAMVSPGCILRGSLRFLSRHRRLRFEQFRKLVRRHGLAEIEALEFVASVLAQKVRLRLGFHTLGEDGQTQVPAHCYGGLGNTSVLRLIGQVMDKRAIDLYSVDRKFPEIGQRGITYSKIIYCQANADVPERF